MRISPGRADKVSGWAEEYYDAALPFHNWSHGIEVMEESLSIARRGGERTQHINRGLLQIAAAWHDAGHNDPERFNYESPEHYSARLCLDRLTGELTASQLSEVEQTILATRMDKPRQTLAGIALHYGDVGNMAHEYTDFHDHTTRLWREHGCLEWTGWRQKAHQVIMNVASEADRELPELAIYDDEIQMRMQRNALRLIGEKAPTP